MTRLLDSIAGGIGAQWQGDNVPPNFPIVGERLFPFVAISPAAGVAGVPTSGRATPSPPIRWPSSVEIADRTCRSYGILMKGRYLVVQALLNDTSPAGSVEQTSLAGSNSAPCLSCGTVSTSFVGGPE
jgi:hypothetical protein